MGQHYTLIRHLLPPARNSIWGYLFWRRSLWGDRLDCLAQLAARVTPQHHLTNIRLKVSGQLREKRWELVNLQTIIHRPLINSKFWQSNVQRGNRIIVIDTFFATSFSDLFRLKINFTILSIDPLSRSLSSIANNSYAWGYVITSLLCWCPRVCLKCYAREQEAFEFISKIEFWSALKKPFAWCLAQVVRIYFYWSHN